MQTTKSQQAGERTQEFQVGQLVSVGWENLGEITEYLWNGFYRVFVESDTDRGSSAYQTIHANRLEAVK